MTGETKTVLVVFGTRPEAIKMAPLVLELRKHPEKFRTLVCVTGQHRSMLDQVLEVFGIVPDFDLDIMKQGQDLYDVTSRVLLGMRDVLDKVKPQCVVVHGDTTTSMAAALAAFYRQIPVAHVEAGLRTRDILSPWPEEMNRQITGRLARIHFAPTSTARLNLMAEGVDPSAIVVTGNTVIDALRIVVDKIAGDGALTARLDDHLRLEGYDPARVEAGRRMVLITGHRRENFGEGFLSICRAIARLAAMHPDVDFVYPMHLNPNVRRPIVEVFGAGDACGGNLFFIEPQEYLSFVRLMSVAHVVLTDSGGIQEEAPGLGKPVLVMRDTTERPEAVDAGTVKLVGTDECKIVEEVSRLLDNDSAHAAMANAVNPYGDGRACPRIIEGLYNYIR
ncbi:MAG: UDP-N-acetylglucosamine 2-epimerase (non-hydrolyzing) [Muribaculaceae bacterium]|nr:UDP-N-acetylglucosamine 2-epimerase (non-hydrolyzing) [Muribaculaceae bacterium]